MSGPGENDPFLTSSARNQPIQMQESQMTVEPMTAARNQQPSRGGNPQKARNQMPRRKAKAGNMISLCLVPFIVFAGLLCSFMFLMHFEEYAVWGIILGIGGCALISFVAFATGFGGAKSESGRVYNVGFAANIVVAVGIGMTVGLWIYREDMFDYWNISEGQTYDNVAADFPPEIYADAGVLKFSNNFKLDAVRAVGYAANSLICVAPVLAYSSALSGKPVVNFWAVGEDCCKARGGFTCDDAVDPDASSAVVIREQKFAFGGKHTLYREAIDMAKSVYGIQSAKDPIFVRWVKDPEKIRKGYWTEGLKKFIIGLIVFLLFDLFMMGVIGQAMKNSNIYAANLRDGYASQDSV